MIGKIGHIVRLGAYMVHIPCGVNGTTTMLKQLRDLLSWPRFKLIWKVLRTAEGTLLTDYDYIITVLNALRQRSRRLSIEQFVPVL